MLKYSKLLILVLALWFPSFLAMAEDGSPMSGEFAPASDKVETGVLAGTDLFVGPIGMKIDKDRIEAALPMLQLVDRRDVSETTLNTFKISLVPSDRPDQFVDKNSRDPRGERGLIWARRDAKGMTIYRFRLLPSGRFSIYGLQLVQDGGGIAARAWLESDAGILGTAAVSLERVK